MTEIYNDDIIITFDETETNNLSSVNFALNTLNQIREFRDMLSIATSDRPLEIVLRGYQFGGSTYIPNENKIYLDMREIAGTQITTESGEIRQTSLQEVIVHELQHAIQSSDYFSAAVSDSGLFSDIFNSWILEPDAIDLTNDFREQFFGVDPREGHSAISDESLALDGPLIFDFFGQGTDEFGQPLTVSAADIGSEYLNVNLNGFVFETDTFSGLYFGDLFEDFQNYDPETLQYWDIGGAGDVLSDLFDGIQAFFANLVSPLVIDLDGDGIELATLSGSTTYFDLNVDGFAERTGCVASDDGILAVDANSNGLIDDNSELFGNATGFSDGFAQLATLDSNSDGVIDVNDTAYASLLVWRDYDGDGISDEGELVSLADTGIVSIDLNALWTCPALVPPDGNPSPLKMG